MEPMLVTIKPVDLLDGPGGSVLRSIGGGAPVTVLLRTDPDDVLVMTADADAGWVTAGHLVPQQPLPQVQPPVPIVPPVIGVEPVRPTPPVASTPGNPGPFRSLVPGGSFSPDPFDRNFPVAIRCNNPGAIN